MGELLKHAMTTLAKESPDFKKALNVLLKYEIYTLLQRLSDNGEESVVITASVADGVKSQLGSRKGEDFLQNAHEFALLKERFLQFCGGNYSLTSQPANTSWNTSVNTSVNTTTNVSTNLPINPVANEPVVIKTEPAEPERVEDPPYFHSPSKQSRLSSNENQTSSRQVRTSQQVVIPSSLSSISATEAVATEQQPRNNNTPGFGGDSAKQKLPSRTSKGFSPNYQGVSSSTSMGQSPRSDRHIYQGKGARRSSTGLEPQQLPAAMPQFPSRPASSSLMMPPSAPTPLNQQFAGPSKTPSSRPMSPQVMNTRSPETGTSPQSENQRMGTHPSPFKRKAKPQPTNHPTNHPSQTTCSQSLALSVISQETVTNSQNSALNPYMAETELDSDEPIILDDQPTPTVNVSTPSKWLNTSAFKDTAGREIRQVMNTRSPETVAYHTKTDTKTETASNHGNEEDNAELSVSFMCRRCGAVFENQHKRDVHEGLYCGASANSNGPYACDICGIEFTDEGLYHQHRYIVHVSSHRKYPRHDDEDLSDSEMSSNQDENEAIISSMHKPSVHIYPHFKRFPKVFKNGGHMKGKGVTVTSPEATSHCSYSGGYNSTKVSESSRGVKPFVCTHCGKGFNAKRYLQAHSDLHDTSTKHQCPFCNVSYPQKNSLRKHITRKHPSKQEFESDQIMAQNHM